MTYEKPDIRQEGQGFRMELESLGSCSTIGGIHVATEEIPIIDERLKTAWKHNIFRTLAAFAGREVQIVIWRNPL